ncbi:unnamed protein product [Tuber melanosporum]|uniref:(Perigord truffle) hypothetical protein n=1 Tax=Tuber melanosporum (strain Mel28) TaxID=656061 RepID=D5G3V0_TUBMM|nr:uncharacterized protein GSTUM_00003813001 [Tuber melanosporum]CAZ79193.1 unnamed protein product [Tuber melanosporum]
MGQSQSTRRPEPGATYRAKAASEAQAQIDASRKAKAASRNSDHRSARAHSIEAQMHGKKMNEYHALASSEVFRYHNPKYPSTAFSFFGALFSLVKTPPNDLSQLDLHGQRVAEAVPMVKDHLRMCRKEGIKRTLVITGRGVHSLGGVPRIKPEVERLLAEMGVRYWSRAEGGAFMVECGREEGGGIVGWIWRGIFG